jgi:hypothetical protein
MFKPTVLLVSLMVAPVCVLAQQASPSPDTRYVDFPRRIDPSGTHKHIPLRAGSVLFGRQEIVIHQIIVDRKGHSVDDAYIIDAASSITRLRGETLVVEPDGTTWHLSASARVDRTSPAWGHVVIPPGKPIPAYLQSSKPDIDLRSPSP